VANTVSSFYQTLVAATTEASQALVGPNAFLDSIYIDFKPEAASIGQTLNVALPNGGAPPTSSVADGGVADPVFTDISFTTEAIIFSQHPQYNYIIRDFEQFNSPLAIRQIFMDAAIKAVAEYADTQVAALFTTGNFTTNTAIAGTGNGGGTNGDSIAVKDFLKGQAALLSQRVNVNDVQNMTLIQHPVPYTNLLADTAWTQQSIASELVAERVRTTGEIRVGFGSTIAHDLFAPYNGGTTTYTGCYFHRWAVALATRPLPPPDAKVADYMYVMYKGIPLRITLCWSVIHNGYCVLVEAGYGLKVVRQNMGQLFTTVGA
jgi:hypothetical protein